VIVLAYGFAAILGGMMVAAAFAGKPVKDALDEMQDDLNAD
jgi:hypothetical protein